MSMKKPFLAAPHLWTIGHSTRSADGFLQLLTTHGIRLLVDSPLSGSRRFPHFYADQLAERLTRAGLSYEHLPALGGRRPARADSMNLGWRNASFRGYADYMETDAFQRALDRLAALGRETPAAVMCAEAVPWRCHRSLIADALLVRGWEVLHIMGGNQVLPHQLPAFAVVQGERLLYPATAEPDSAPRLF